MSDYISREDAMDAWYTNERYTDIEGIPSADVVEQKHGKWLDVPDPDDMYVECECSECHERYFKFHSSLDFKWIPYNYCPNCGASMRQQEETE